MTRILWELPFPSSHGASKLISELPKRNLAVTVKGDEAGVQIVFEQVEAYKCTYYFALADEMMIAYDRIVDMGETNWLAEVRNRLRKHGKSLSLPSGPPDQLLHLMINFDDGPCYEFICQNFHVEQISS